MAKQDYTKHQQGIIQRYYENKDAIMLTKLQELLTEIYLAADEPKKLERLWGRVQKAMTNLKVKPALAAHILEKRDPEILARNLNDWLKNAR